MAKAAVQVGFTRSNYSHYDSWQRRSLVGADIEATDGLGNIIKVSVRERGIGYRISLNGKDIAVGETKPI